MNFISERELKLNEFSKNAFLTFLKNEKNPKNLSAYKTPINKLIKIVAPENDLIDCIVYKDRTPKTIIETLLEYHFEKFLNDSTGAAKSEKTKEEYRKAFRLFAKFCDAKELNQFNSIAMGEYRKKLLLEYEQGQKSLFSVNAYLAPLRSFAKYLMLNTEEIFEGVELEKIPKIERDLNRMAMTKGQSTNKSEYYKDALSHNEVLQVLKKTQNSREKLIIGLMYYCGLRTFEVLKAKLSDFNFKAEELNVIGKNRKGASIPLDYCLDAVKELLNNYLRQNKPDKEGYLFPSINTTASIRKFVNKTLKSLDLKEKKKKVSAHSFRHSLAQNLILQGIRVETVQKIMRHSNIATTEKYFKRLQNENLLQIPKNALSLNKID